jgi:hypothetical protein
LVLVLFPVLVPLLPLLFFGAAVVGGVVVRGAAVVGGVVVRGGAAVVGDVVDGAGALVLEVEDAGAVELVVASVVDELVDEEVDAGGWVVLVDPWATDLSASAFSSGGSGILTSLDVTASSFGRASGSSIDAEKGFPAVA